MYRGVVHLRGIHIADLVYRQDVSRRNVLRQVILVNDEDVDVPLPGFQHGIQPAVVGLHIDLLERHAGAHRLPAVQERVDIAREAVYRHGVAGVVDIYRGNVYGFGLRRLCGRLRGGGGFRSRGGLGGRGLLKIVLLEEPHQTRAVFGSAACQQHACCCRGGVSHCLFHIITSFQQLPYRHVNDILSQQRHIVNAPGEKVMSVLC